MLRNKLIYAILLGILVLFLILYRGKLSLELLLFAVALPCLLRILLWILRFSLRFRLSFDKKESECGRPFSALMEIQNHSVIPASCALLRFRYQSSLSANSQEETLQIPILTWNTQRISYGFRMYTCGEFRFRFEALTIFDPLRLFHSKLSVNKEETFCILPELLELPEDFWETLLRAEMDADTFAPDKPGDDPSEIYDLHEYRIGDPVSRIHWKLSSKTDRVLVKEYSFPVPDRFLLLADYTHTADFPESGLRLHTMLSVCRSVAHELCTNQRSCICSALDQGTGTLRTVLEDSPYACDRWFQELLRNSPCPLKDHEKVFSAMSEYLSENGQASHIFLCLPMLSDEMTAWIAALPYAERITVMAVCSPLEEPPALEALPFSVLWIPWIDHRKDAKQEASERIGQNETEVMLS